jgi:peptidoglycan/LPS O-acetylase OafA/YrhL
MFYLFFPLACWLLGRGKGLVLLLCAFAVLGPFARTILAHGNEVWKEYSYLGGMDAIALGCLAAIFISHRPLTRRLTQALFGIGLTLLVFCLCFEDQVVQSGLEKVGLNMSVLAVGACMLIAAAAESKWRAPRFSSPLLAYGRRSYEVYLTHMFVVFAFFDLFVMEGKPIRMIPVLFLLSILVSGVLGEVIAKYFSEPANRWLRAHFGNGAKSLGSVVEVR